MFTRRACACSLPAASDLPGTDKPTVTVAMDVNGRYISTTRWSNPEALREELHQAAKKSAAPLTLVVQADKVGAVQHSSGSP